MNRSKTTRTFLFVSLLFVYGILHAQGIDELLDQPVFNKLTGEDGLSQGRISDIVQDQAGFMWFGTRDGLNRWDGYSMEVYKNQPGNPTSIPSNVIEKIMLDPKGHLWILTENGLCSHNPATSKFTTLHIDGLSAEIKMYDFTFDKNGKLLLATNLEGLFEIDTATRKLTTYTVFGSTDQNDDIRLVFVDVYNRIWLSKRKGGVQMFDRSTGKISSFQKEPETQFDINQYYITAIVEDNDGNLWMGSGSAGLIFFDLKTMLYKSYTHLENGEYINGRSILDLAFQDETKLWIASDSEGLICLNIQNQSFRQYTEGETKNTLLYRTIKSLHFDRAGNLWIGTNGKGLNILSPYSKKFFTVTKTTLSGFGLSFSSVRSIYEDAKHITWVGGYSGLQRIDFDKNTSERVFGHVIYTICPDPSNENILWLGTEGDGLHCFNKTDFSNKQFPTYDEYSNAQLSNKMLHGYRVYDIYPVSENTLYIATSQGLNIFDTKTETFSFFKINVPDPSFMIESGLTTIYFDKNNQLWLGSFTGGLLKMNKDLSVEKIFTNNPDKPDLPGNRVNCIYEDNKGRFWIATNMGLCLMNRDEETFVTYTETDGLPNNTIYGILEDAQGCLWLSTNNGISRFNPEKKAFKNYNKSDGLPGNELNAAAWFQYNKSRLYFGGVDGLVVFNPENVRSDENPPLMDFTRLKVFSHDTLTKFHLTGNQEVEIKPDALLLELEFSAFSFINPADCQYAYQFGEERKEWIQLGNNRTITLTKPEHGIYPLKLKASNSDGVWNEEPVMLKLIVLPRYYQTGWFRIVVITFILSVIAMAFYLRQVINKKQQEKLHLLIQQRTEELSLINEELNQANASKDKFFSIIAHDLKNPFNSLLGFTDLLITDWEIMNQDEKFEIVKILKKTTENTYELLINLLDWANIQRKKTVASPEGFILFEVVNDIVSQFSMQCDLKNIALRTEINSELYVFYDLNMFNGIMRNLVGNAIKFSHQGGQILIKAFVENEENAVCQVKDNGIGMDNDKLVQLLNEQYIQSTPGTDGEPGTGLGLSLCREFIKMHGGKLWVESQPGKGSSFFFTIPLKLRNT